MATPCIEDSATIHLSMDGTALKADAKLSATAGQRIVALGDGLYSPAQLSAGLAVVNGYSTDELGPFTDFNIDHYSLDATFPVFNNGGYFGDQYMHCHAMICWDPIEVTTIDLGQMFHDEMVIGGSGTGVDTFGMPVDVRKNDIHSQGATTPGTGGTVQILCSIAPGATASFHFFRSIRATGSPPSNPWTFFPQGYSFTAQGGWA